MKRKQNKPRGAVQATQELRSSGAAGPHQDRRQRRTNHRATADTKAAARSVRENQ